MGPSGFRRPLFVFRESLNVAYPVQTQGSRGVNSIRHWRRRGWLNCSGFSLIEQVVAVAIVALVATPITLGLSELARGSSAQITETQMQNLARSEAELVNRAPYATSSTLEPVASDGFESGGGTGGSGWLSPWSFTGTAQVTQAGRPHSGNWRLSIADAPGTATRQLDLAGDSGPLLIVWAKADGFTAADHGSISVSPDGATYHTLKTWTSIDSDGVYHRWAFDLSGFATSTRYRIRVSATSSAGAFFSVDDLAIDNRREVNSPYPTVSPVPDSLSVSVLAVPAAAYTFPSPMQTTTLTDDLQEVTIQVTCSRCASGVQPVTLSEYKVRR